MFLNMLYSIDKMRIFVTVIVKNVPRGTELFNLKNDDMIKEEKKQEVDQVMEPLLKKLCDGFCYLDVTHACITVVRKDKQQGYLVQFEYNLRGQ